MSNWRQVKKCFAINCFMFLNNMYNVKRQKQLLSAIFSVCVDGVNSIEWMVEWAEII